MLLEPVFADDDVEVRDAGITLAMVPLLDRVQLDVIALARHDRLSSVAPPGRASRWASRLFGIRPAAPLANPDLEALRFYCVLTRHRDPRAAAAWEDLRAIGLSGTHRLAVDALTHC